MKGYFIALVLITIIGFSVIGIIIYNSFPHPITVVLNTSKMTKGSIDAIDRGDSNSIVAAYLCGKKNSANDSIPWADVFVCEFNKDTISKHADTIVFLDTDLRKSMKNAYFNIFRNNAKESTSFKQCKILVPDSVKNRLKKYKYLYAHIILTVDD